ncbi:MAG: hypothetical protein L0Y38_01990, partial [Methylococcaceae bacterium]|nr:hypothetical protein [Methylococcaceae bacterium]
AGALDEKNNDSLYHWGLTLYQQSRKEDPAHARALLLEACDKFSRAAGLRTGLPNTYNDWAVALLALANLSGDEEKKHLLAEARAKCLEAEKIKSGFASYNLACIASLSGDVENCRRYLETAREQLKIPSPGHLENDPDFKNVRKSDWFKEIAAKVRVEF